MKQYVLRARELAEHGELWGRRELAWQTFGTHYVLAAPMKLFGSAGLQVGAILWGIMGAAAVPLGYLLACRVCRRAWVAKTVGIVLLVWFPNLSNSGYFLSETPFLCFQLWSTYWLVVTFQDGRRALGAGIVSAIAFLVRPQTAIYFVLVLLLWLLHRKRLPSVRLPHVALVAAPLLLALAFSIGRFRAHTGYWGGIAENSNMNLTAGRCHNIVTQAFGSEQARQRSERRKNTRDGRRVGLPGYRMLARKLGPRHPLALRPAFDDVTIRMVGYIGDPLVHRQIRRECYRRTGLWGQARYSVVNVMLLWFVARQWPEMERGWSTYGPYSEFYKHTFQIVFWLPSLIGVGWALAVIRRRPMVAVVAFQLLTSMTIAAIFFGDIRLRTPYDPYAIILALEVASLAADRIRARIVGSRSKVTAPS
jgi:hypothetical protein